MRWCRCCFVSSGVFQDSRVEGEEEEEGEDNWWLSVGRWGLLGRSQALIGQGGGHALRQRGRLRELRRSAQAAGGQQLALLRGAAAWGPSLATLATLGLRCGVRPRLGRVAEQHLVALDL